mmetsp:Transcript_1702/g.3728  ORF Transcript_1702/g.3728 Transcript_1702/m.3728 type:complete len:541 (+) Transcript_1702:133-1755(+)|eukprot:CAMPEP_0172554634 /NCGR_PEP_ID=MMETSP1067-20121228/55550_1 /TAXON_ID=265564 ORGANISM="Thalassiosira punctigera, Strain Tpunct2005C2" /NCGR_SAMPLE_ID=MMETSP1067 /ASSEMBLY_ACC=CAM_ASM_000444 /LENGTH=540 /DNA_ID=CAMNT_0013343043 /DNA_START=101 /DNA_END=1723 /DNA_ORIENTATION=+
MDPLSKVSSKIGPPPPAGVPGLKGLISRRAMEDDPMGTDLLGGGEDPADRFNDADDDSLMPALPPLLASGTERRDSLGDDYDGGGLLGMSLAGSKRKASSDEGGGGAKDPPKAAAALKSSASGGLGSGSPPTSLASDFRGGQESWNVMLYQLLLYKAQRGDLNIPHNDTSYRLLYNWVQTQRKHFKLYQENKTSSTFLNADRIAVLDAIDFQWNVRGDTFWQKNFDSLVKYKNEHGDVRVPRLYAKNPKLGEWVTDQRRQWKSKMEGKPNLMTDERKAKLDEIGFVWKVRDRADWNDRYEQLLEFKKENGHCIVPQHYQRNRALGKWVAKQREQYRFYREGKHSFLTEERIDLLKSVGFVWQIKGRGVNKKQSPHKLAGVGSVNIEVKEKSLAKMEEEENEMKKMGMASVIGLPGDRVFGGLKPSPSPKVTGVKTEVPGVAMGGPSMGGDQKIPSLPTIAQKISQQQLLQANMAAIAAHASSNQNMVADLAAALRLGGTNNPSATAAAALTGADPRVAAALRAAQLGSDPKNQRSFSSML